MLLGGIVGAALSLIASEVYRSFIPSEEVRRLASVEAKLEPFVELAQTKFPQLETEEALAELARDIEITRALATRDVFRPLNSNVRGPILQSLRDVRQRHDALAPDVEFTTSGSSATRTKRLGQELAELLSEAGFKSSFKTPAFISVPRRNAGPVDLQFHPDAAALVQELAQALGPLITARATAEQTPEAPVGLIRFRIHGEPEFNPDGTVVFR